jgi:hypothetical protein
VEWQECRRSEPVPKFDSVAAFLKDYPRASRVEEKVRKLVREFGELSFGKFLEMRGVANALADLEK